MIKTAICVPIKNETDYLKEWIDWHLNLGITDIYLYEDDNSDSHVTITSQYENVHLGYITTVLNSEYYKGVNFQKSGSWKQGYLYEWFFHTYRDKYDWILMIDIDEFLVIKQPLQILLQSYKNEPGIMFKWRIMTACGNIDKVEGNVVDNYTEIYKKGFDSNFDTKSMINCHLNKKLEWDKHNHRVKGAVYPHKNGVHLAYINHYFTKSWEEWTSKLLVRGDLMEGHRKIWQFFTINEDMLNIKDVLLSEIKNK